MGFYEDNKFFIIQKLQVEYEQGFRQRKDKRIRDNIK